MKTEFLIKKTDHTRLILIAAGWSAGPEIANDIALPGWDVAVIHDFTELTFDSAVLDGYYTIYLFAWSLGVYAAARLIDSYRITSAIAINGTLTPIDDNTGIPDLIYAGTLDALNERNLFKFRLRMTGDKAEAMRLSELGKTNIDNLQYQLDNIRNDYRHNGKSIYSLPWHRVFISENDHIFPPANLEEAWKAHDETEIIKVSGHHYLKMSDIIRMVIADTSTVSQRFSKAAITYDTHAIAQYSSAIKLAHHLEEYTGQRGGKLLEIGCGTGLFTKEYSRFLHPERATFVDITPTGPFGISISENYVIADAEQWIEKTEEEFDFILSASAIQWFADIPRFFQNCRKRLSAEGLICISTFLPGNMEELDSVRPSPLRYPDAKRLLQLMELNFEDVLIIPDEIRVEFRSVREMLMHLKHTGVGGSAPTSKFNKGSMSQLRSLTYRPVYILGRKNTRKK